MACFNIWGQVIILDITNKVVFELKLVGCRQGIPVMDTQSNCYLEDSSDCIAENELKESTRVLTIVQTGDESYQTGSEEKYIVSKFIWDIESIDYTHTHTPSFA